MRKDAEVNRRKLIEAGRRVMQDEGGDVPVERLCEMAGLTRATFYRNFPDRATLYETVLETELRSMAAAINAERDDPLGFVRLFAEMMMVYDRFLAALPDMADYPADAGNEAKIVAVIEPPLRRAQDAGVIARRITGDQIMLGCRMIAANWRHDRQPTREAAMARRLDLLLVGIGAGPQPR